MNRISDIAGKTSTADNVHHSKPAVSSYRVNPAQHGSAISKMLEDVRARRKPPYLMAEEVDRYIRTIRDDDQ